MGHAAPRHTIRRLALAAAVGPWLAGGCTRVSDEQRFPPNAAPLQIVTTVPRQGDTGVPPDVVIDLCFSGRIDPRSVSDLDARITSGREVVDVKTFVQLAPWRGPGGSAISPGEEPWCSDSVLSITPAAPLARDVVWRVSVRPTARGWAGEILDTDTEGWTTPEEGSPRFILEFEVAGDAPTEPTLPAPTLKDLFAAGEIFDPARTTCSCHRDPEDLAHARLDLTSPQAAYAGLVLDGKARETGFPMVSQQRPSDSFLFQKLLRDHDGAPMQGILGDPMPPDAPLPYPDLLAIAHWIEAGALP